MKHLAKIQSEFVKLSLDWLEREVEHRTPSGQIRRVKVKSLSKDEREKYKPKLDQKRKEELNSTIEGIFNDILNTGNTISLLEAIKKNNFSNEEIKYIADEVMHDVRLGLKNKPGILDKIEKNVRNIIQLKTHLAY